MGIATRTNCCRDARSRDRALTGRFAVITRALLLPLLCGLSLALASAASAQPVSSAGTLYDAGMPPYRVLALMRATGFEPVGRPVRVGDTYRLRALDPNNIEYLLILDARTGRTVSVREIGMPGPYAAMPAYGPYRGPVYGRVFAPPADDYGFGYGSPRPPRDVPHARPLPQPSKSAQAPLPRPRPYVMEATGSIPADAPKAPAPQKTPEPQKTPDPPPHNGGAAMPPVAPLE
jgi:hypothetical protein